MEAVTPATTKLVALTLSEWASMADWRMLFLHRDRVKQVTAADMQRVAAAYLKPSNRTLVTFVPTEKPDRAEIPVTPDVTALVAAYRGDTALAQGEAGVDGTGSGALATDATLTGTGWTAGRKK